MKKMKGTYPQNLKVMLRAIEGRGIKTAEAMIEEELLIYGGRLRKNREKRRS
ncbi:hypothetical protein ES703_16286 [subsurface metagenome]